ncbi:hypothetical protein GCM10023081_11540 [Arthrobacter ginkgonis]|uniref:DUF4244 domain-containing protein n=1 Tax=Arthrobacter ginkgonis TaxID=1630594 RepID=A0ABP7BZP8_9MICC
MHPHHDPGRRNASALRGRRTIDRGSSDWPAEGIPAKGPAEAPGRGTSEDGIATAEFAIVTLAAVGFAGLLVTILTSGDVRELLLGLVRQALSY